MSKNFAETDTFYKSVMTGNEGNRKVTTLHYFSIALEWISLDQFRICFCNLAFIQSIVFSRSHIWRLHLLFIAGWFYHLKWYSVSGSPNLIALLTLDEVKQIHTHSPQMAVCISLFLSGHISTHPTFLSHINHYTRGNRHATDIWSKKENKMEDCECTRR